MIKDSNLTGVIKQFSNLDPTSHLTDPEQRRKIDLIKTEEVKEPKRKVVEPIEIPEIISVPRTRPIKKTEVIESNTRPQIPVGLSQRFTQDKIREAQILKELDREMVSERKNNISTTNEAPLELWLAIEGRD